MSEINSSYPYNSVTEQPKYSAYPPKKEEIKYSAKQLKAAKAKGIKYTNPFFQFHFPYALAGRCWKGSAFFVDAEDNDIEAKCKIRLTGDALNDVVMTFVFDSKTDWGDILYIMDYFKGFKKQGEFDVDVKADVSEEDNFKLIVHVKVDENTRFKQGATEVEWDPQFPDLFSVVPHLPYDYPPGHIGATPTYKPQTIPQTPISLRLNPLSKEIWGDWGDYVTQEPLKIEFDSPIALPKDREDLHYPLGTAAASMLAGYLLKKTLAK